METAIKKFPTTETSSSSSSSSSMPSLRTLEIKVISGEDLRINRRQLVKNSFVEIKTESVNSMCPDQITTKLNTEGGSNPVWNEKIVIGMPMHARFITVEVKCNRNRDYGRIIGIAKIPVSDFMGGLVPENYLHFLSYRLRDTQGEKNGIINLSVTIKNPGIGNAAAAANNNFAPLHACSKQQPWTAGVPLPAVDSRFSYKNQGQVVTGIPVRLPNF